MSDPGLQIPGGHAPKNRVDEAGRPGTAYVLGQVDRGGHSGVMADPGGQELMSAKPEDVAYRRVEIVPVAAGGEDRVVGTAAAQRAVGQFGGEGRVPAGQASLPEEGRQQQVGVGVPVRDRAQHVVGSPPGRIRVRPAIAGLAGPGLAGPGLVRPGLAGPGLAGPGLAGPGLAGPGLAGPGLAAAGLAGTGTGRARMLSVPRHVSQTAQGRRA